MVKEINKAHAKPRGITEVEQTSHMKGKGKSRLGVEGLTGKESSSLQIEEGTICKGTGPWNKYYTVHSWSQGQEESQGEKMIWF